MYSIEKTMEYFYTSVEFIGKDLLDLSDMSDIEDEEVPFEVQVIPYIFLSFLQTLASK